MRSWLIVVANMMIATTAAILLDGGLPSRVGAIALGVSQWPGLAAVWLCTYGMSAPVLSSIGEIADNGSIAAPDWARRYAIRLGVTQYFTCLLLLFALGTTRLVLRIGPAPGTSVLDGYAAGLIAWGAVVVTGLICWLCFSAWMLSKPQARVLEGREELELLRKIAASINARPSPVTPDLTELTTVIEQAQRSVLEGVKDVAAEANQVWRGMRKEFGGLKTTLVERLTPSTAETLSVAQAAMDRAASEVHATVALLDSSLARLADIAASMAAREDPSTASNDAAAYPGRSQLSAELSDLLRQMTTARPTGKSG